MFNSIVDILALPSEDITLNHFLEDLENIEEFSNSRELFHSRAYHPEGDGSLYAHMVEVFNTWVQNPLRTLLGYYGILFHDIGKQECAEWKGDDKGFHSFIKHESVGVRIFMEKYSDMNPFVSENKDGIAWVIAQHTNFWNVKKHGKSLAIATHPRLHTLHEVCKADKMGFKDEECMDRYCYFLQLALLGEA